jgi:hypothetical protein
MLWAGISIRARCTTLCDKVCQWLAASQWFSPCTPVSSSNKTDCHDITEILLKVALNTIKQTNKQTLTNSFVSCSWNVVTKSSSLNEPPYWILKIQLVNYYNMIENKDTAYLWNNFYPKMTRKMLRKFSNDITTFYDVYEPKLSTIFIDILVFCYFSTLSSAQLKYFCFALKYK